MHHKRVIKKIQKSKAKQTKPAWRISTNFVFLVIWSTEFETIHIHYFVQNLSSEVHLIQYMSVYGTSSIPQLKNYAEER